MRLRVKIERSPFPLVVLNSQVVSRERRASNGDREIQQVPLIRLHPGFDVRAWGDEKA